MPQPLDHTNIDVALDLLTEGFPERSRDFFSIGIERMRAFGGNDEAGVPLGRVLFDGAKPAGVVLTPASVRHGADGLVRRIVNMSSWYIRPEQRWRAALMLRQIIRDETAIYTDLTPTADVQRMLPALGFAKFTDGIELIPVAYGAMPAGGARVVDLANAPPGAVGAETRRMLEAHRSLNCWPASLVVGGQHHPLLFKPRRIKMLPMAALVYCESNKLLRQHLPAVSRYLIDKRVGFLLRDLAQGEHARGVTLRNRSIRFARGDNFDDRTDYAGSELCLLDF